MIMENDRKILRELAKQYLEIAQSPKHVRMRQRFRDSNDLKIVRPPLIIEEIPWHQMNGSHELDCFCTDPKAKEIEYAMRVQLYREKHFACDNCILPVWQVRKSFENSGYGFDADEKQLSVDEGNNIVSHEYHDILAEESSLGMFHLPVITAHPEKDAENVTFVQEMFGDILPVQLIGTSVYYAPWDQIPRFRGVTPILEDLYDRPEYLHQIIALLTKAMDSEITQMEKLGLYGGEDPQIHCTPGDITYPEGENPPVIHTWFRTMAQMFSSISPKQHYEFDIAYSVPLAKRFAYTYYGCCEPLHDRIDWVKKYPNLRKVGCSPWAKVEETAEQLGGDFVLSRKPNPANVAIATDPEVIRQEITETVKACQKYGCPCDITLKDISTVAYKPENLILWAKTASEVLDEYYGEA